MRTQFFTGIVLGVALAALPARAEVLHWNVDPGPADWDEAGNWVENKVPEAGDDCYVGGVYPGTVLLPGGSPAMAGELFVSAGGTVQAAASNNKQFSVGDGLRLQGGVLEWLGGNSRLEGVIETVTGTN
jgi:hypothetical protein